MVVSRCSIATIFNRRESVWLNRLSKVANENKRTINEEGKKHTHTHKGIRDAVLENV